MGEEDREKQQHHKADDRLTHSRGELIFAAAMIRWESWSSAGQMAIPKESGVSIPGQNLVSVRNRL